MPPRTALVTTVLQAAVAGGKSRDVFPSNTQKAENGYEDHFDKLPSFTFCYNAVSRTAGNPIVLLP